jgi:hypothetical protein
MCYSSVIAVSPAAIFVFINVVRLVENRVCSLLVWSSSSRELKADAGEILLALMEWGWKKVVKMKFLRQSARKDK